ncbi:two-component system phosphate regulon sensor histidine kinase PhoR [Ulvibacter sp. MAR_2010_11]|uniref:sensor histidine kinase n=1 Tax=Ulvibacter sp. MAR_2010_11 TaxID=1250229 RepID=UPI000C2BEB3C|nr:HAMP domain-containing sensor histidine kinase [Ulvibacter sp. MAR_2010_11]PKA83349.1 two-component system phosphate regulon sensor histidine kinase PhoR [Ulvibacter sp. MAR_2010_11]
MQERHYKTILYFIIAVILVTLAMQVYWNYKNYEAGKQQLINEVQISLDNAVDEYYASLAKKNVLNFAFNRNADSIQRVTGDSEKIQFEYRGDTLPPLLLSKKRQKNHISIVTCPDSIEEDSLFKLLTVDQTFKDEKKVWLRRQDSAENVFKILTSKVMLAITSEEIDLKALDTLVGQELRRKNIRVDYGMVFTSAEGFTERTNEAYIADNALTTVSKSGFLPHASSLQLYFTNETLTILRKNLMGILLSFLFAIAVIGCLLYLLQIIRRQKQLAEIKNDLISNITHEFKTPIATIGAAMEGIQQFNDKNDAEKNLRYARISTEQVEKLNLMVEKLLETATLDSENLELNFETINLVEVLKKAAAKEIFSNEDKVMRFEASEEEITYPIDAFHFENAINNIIDNAIKYGGDEISVGIHKLANAIEITITDSGASLSEEHRKQIFDKFYRVPKGNTHDVKGFGIGLYYTKKIIEKHKGTISLTVKKQTTFKINLPND